MQVTEPGPLRWAGGMSETVCITYEAVVPEKWDLDQFSTETAMGFADLINEALEEGPGSADLVCPVRWVGTRQTIPANQHPTWGEPPPEGGETDNLVAHIMGLLEELSVAYAKESGDDRTADEGSPIQTRISEAMTEIGLIPHLLPGRLPSVKDGA